MENLQAVVDDKRRELSRRKATIEALETKNAQSLAGKRLAEQRLAELSRMVDEIRKNAAAVEKQNQDVREEIRVVIERYNESRSAVARLEERVKQQAERTEELECGMKQKDAELKKREGYLNRVLKQLEEKKGQLRSANLKVIELNRSVVSELRSKLAERERELSTATEMIKGHNAEMQTKTREIARLRKEVERLKELPKSFTGTPDALVDEHSPADNQGDNTAEEAPKSKPDRGPARKEKQWTFKEKYMRKLDDYYSAISDSGYRNNSLNIRHVLSQNYSAFTQDTSNQGEELSAAKSKKPELRRHSNAYDPTDFDVTRIIQKSLVRHGVSTDKRQSVAHSPKKKAPGATVASPLLGRKLHRLLES